MIKVSDSVKAKINSTARTFTCKITVGENTITEVKKLTHKSPFCSGSNISIGDALSSFVECEIENYNQSLKGYEISVSIFLGDTEFKLGKFTVKDSTMSNGTQKIVAYDKMNYASTVKYKASGTNSISQIFMSACGQCGIMTTNITHLELKVFDDNKIVFDENLLVGMDCRKIFGYIAGLLGKNAVIDTAGALVFKTYNKVNKDVCNIDIDNLDTLDFPSENSTINYISCTVDTETTFEVSDPNSTAQKQGFAFANPLMHSTSELMTIYQNLCKTFGDVDTAPIYRVANFKQISGNPCIEAGDIIPVEYKRGEFVDVPVMSLERIFDGGLSIKIVSYEPKTEFNISKSESADIFQNATEKNTENIKYNDIVEKDLKKLNETMANAIGLYKTEITGAGGDIKYYFHNTPDISKSTYIFTFNESGFAYTNNWNGGSPTWTNGLDKNGNAILNYLNVSKISANLIEAGKITSFDGKTVYDLDNGKIYQTSTDEFGNVQETEITAGEVRQKYTSSDGSATSSMSNGNFTSSVKVDGTTYLSTQGGDGFAVAKMTTIEGVPSPIPVPQIQLSGTEQSSLKGLKLTETPLGIESGGTGATTAEKARENLGITPENIGAQKNLGYTPIQQGGGAGQKTNKVYMGWTDSILKAQIDTTDIGEIPTTWNVKNLSNPNQSYMRLGNLLLQWGNTLVDMSQTNTYISTTVNFPVKFGNTPTIMLTPVSGAPNTIFASITGRETSSFSFSTIITAYSGNKLISWFAIGSV